MTDSLEPLTRIAKLEVRVEHIAQTQDEIMAEQRNIRTELAQTSRQIQAELAKLSTSAEFNRGYATGVSATLRTQWMIVGAFFTAAAIWVFHKLTGGFVK